MEKKIAIRLFIVLIVMVLGIVIGYIYWGMSTLSSTTEIDLTKLTLEEKFQSHLDDILKYLNSKDIFNLF
jgi:Tfp pilus assembly protein PilO